MIFFFSAPQQDETAKRRLLQELLLRFTIDVKKQTGAAAFIEWENREQGSIAGVLNGYLYMFREATKPGSSISVKDILEIHAIVTNSVRKGKEEPLVERSGFRNETNAFGVDKTSFYFPEAAHSLSVFDLAHLSTLVSKSRFRIPSQKYEPASDLDSLFSALEQGRVIFAGYCPTKAEIVHYNEEEEDSPEVPRGKKQTVLLDNSPSTEINPDSDSTEMDLDPTITIISPKTDSAEMDLDPTTIDSDTDSTNLDFDLDLDLNPAIAIIDPDRDSTDLNPKIMASSQSPTQLSDKDYLLVLGYIFPDILAQKVQEILDEYYEKSSVKSETSTKIEVIVTAIQKLEQLHPFLDANCRTFCNILLNWMLIENDLPLTLIEDPNYFDVSSIPNLIELTEEGIKRIADFCQNPSFIREQLNALPEGAELLTNISPILQELSTLVLNHSDRLKINLDVEDSRPEVTP